MPENRAVLRRVRCRATSKRSGVRCRKYCQPGHLVCWLHGGGSPQAARAAEARAVVAEVLAAGRRPFGEALADAVTIVDLTMRDLVLEVHDGDGPPDPELVERLVTAAGRAASLAKVAMDAGIPSPDSLAERDAGRIADVVGAVLSGALAALPVLPGDQAALRRWVQRAVPAALRGEPVPPAPLMVRRADLLLPALEDGAVVRARDQARLARAEAGVMAEAAEAVAGLESQNGKDHGRGDSGRPGTGPGTEGHGGAGSAPGRRTGPLVGASGGGNDSAVTPTLADLRSGKAAANPWRRNPWSESIG